MYTKREMEIGKEVAEGAVQRAVDLMAEYVARRELSRELKKKVPNDHLFWMASLQKHEQGLIMVFDGTVKARLAALRKSSS